MQAREIEKLMANAEEGMEKDRRDEGKKMRDSFEEGVSVEAEYAFTKAVGEFCKEAVREGSFKGNYVFNLKEQMGKRTSVEGETQSETDLLVYKK
jgi:hypothetical protein